MPEIPGFIQKGPLGGFLDRNMYYEPDTLYGKPGLISTPGLKLAATLTGAGANKPIRNMIERAGMIVLVADDSLYYSTDGSTYTEVTAFANEADTFMPASVNRGTDGSGAKPIFAFLKPGTNTPIMKSFAMAVFVKTVI